MLHLTNPADCIISANGGQGSLWLGSELSIDPTFLLTHKITVVINMTPHLPLPKLSGVQGYQFPVMDHPSSEVDLYRMLPRITKIIDMHLKNGRNVLVHCQAGIQRSATVVATYLKKYRGLDAERSINHIRSCRKIAFINGFTFKRIIHSKAP